MTVTDARPAISREYWFGATVHLADHVLRTFPDKDNVAVSLTAFTVGVEQPSVKRPIIEQRFGQVAS